MIDYEVAFVPQMDAVKAHQRLYCYRMLRNFDIDCTLPRMFYLCLIKSVLIFCFASLIGLLSQNKKQNSTPGNCSYR